MKLELNKFKLKQVFNHEEIPSKSSTRPPHLTHEAKNTIGFTVFNSSPLLKVILCKFEVILSP